MYLTLTLAKAAIGKLTPTPLIFKSLIYFSISFELTVDEFEELEDIL
ncbi:hypothetical protein J6W34_06860 [bacterium]|nr:hypothetical protein [bacterium]